MEKIGKKKQKYGRDIIWRMSKIFNITGILIWKTFTKSAKISSPKVDEFKFVPLDCLRMWVSHASCNDKLQFQIAFSNFLTSDDSCF